MMATFAVLLIAAQLVGMIVNMDATSNVLNHMEQMLDNMSNGEWLLEQARKYSMMFDKILIEYADKIYSYFDKILNGTIITPSVANDFMNRIYIIIGIVIFFRIAIIAVKYMINPEMFLDDKIGAQTLVKRVIIGSIVIILIPTIFSYATKLQASIIGDRVIEKIVLPEDVYSEYMLKSNPGRDLAMLAFRGFFGWNENVSKNSNTQVYNAYEKVLTYNSLKSFDEKEYINAKQGKQYYIAYVPIISTLAVGYLLFMLIQFALEVALRSFKLLLLQIISPFVITGYMLDTTKEETMKKWVNASISNYLLIFVRVFTLWIATLICYYITNGIPTVGEETSLLNEPDQLLKALIILALFAFLKGLPKIISEIFGYDFQENEAISGIMNQGVGIAKGLAMGKIGADFGKQQIAVNRKASRQAAIGSTISSAGGVIAGIGMTKAGIKSNDLNMGFKGSNMINSNLGSIGSAWSGSNSSISSATSSVISSSFGSSVLSPLSNSASSASNAYLGNNSSDGSGLYSEKDKQGDTDTNGNSGNDNNGNSETVNNATQNNQNNNTFDQNTFAEILQKNGFSIDGGTVNLNAQTSNNTAMQQSQTVSPVVNAMAAEIQTQLKNDNIDANVNDIVGRLNTQIALDNNGNISVSDLTKAMNNVTNSFKVANPTQPQPVNNHTSSLNNNDTIDTI